MFASSAPGESLPPLPRSTHGATSDIRNDVMKTRDIVSDIHRAVVQNQGGSGSKDLLVSDGRALPVTEWPLTVAQTQARLAIEAIDGAAVLHLNPACPGNLHLHSQECSSDATSWSIR